MTLNLKEMTTEEKLQAMEMLWDDLCRNIPESLSPQWHAEVLREREGRIKSLRARNNRVSYIRARNSPNNRNAPFTGVYTIYKEKTINMD